MRIPSDSHLSEDQSESCVADHPILKRLVAQPRLVCPMGHLKCQRRGALKVLIPRNSHPKMLNLSLHILRCVGGRCIPECKHEAMSSQKNLSKGQLEHIAELITCGLINLKVTTEH